MTEKKTEVTNELMFEVLKDIQERIKTLEAMRGEMHQGFASSKGLLASSLHDQARLEERMAALEVELDRIKRRLSLADTSHQH